MKLSVEQLAQDALSLDPLPEVSRLVLHKVLDSSSQPQDVLELVQLDAALCLRLLLLANSQSFGNPGKAATLQDVVRIMDWEIIIDNLMSQVSRVSLTSKPSLIILNDQRLFWQHSLATARFSRLLAIHNDYPDPELAYMAGLLHDFAKVTLYHQHPKPYQAIFEEMEQQHLPMFEAEMRLFKKHHSVIADEILQSWNVPARLRTPIAEHHLLGHGVGTSLVFQLARIVKAADVLAYRIQEGDAGNKLHARSPELLGEIKDLIIKLKPEMIQKEKDALAETYQNIQLGRIDPEEYIDLLARCNRRLGERSMQLRSSLREISLLHHIRQVFLIAHSIQEILFSAGQEIMGALHVRAVAFLLEEDQGDYDLYIVTGEKLNDAMVYNMKHSMAQYWSAQMRTKIDPSTLRVNWLGSSPEKLQKAEEGGSPVRSNNCFMLQGQSGALGVMGVFSERPRVLSQEERERFDIVVELLAMGFDRFCMEEQTRQLSMTDGLTGLLNHRQFELLLTSELKASRRHGFKIGLIIQDLDHFKKVNDTYGHLIGDEVLRELADLLRGHVRESDIVARYGGEEFAVILTHTSLEDARAMADRIREAVESRSFCSERGYNLKLTISQGVACFPAEGIHDEVGLIEASDSALYQAKNSGRNRVISAGQDSPTTS